MASDIPTTMKAWLVTKNGEPRDALTLKTDYPVPSKIKSKNILVKVDYTALNPADLNFMASIPNWIPFRHNPIPGLDFAGTVVKVGSAVPQDLGIGVGTDVCGALNVMSVAVGRGSLAEYIEVPASKVVAKPKGVERKDAAGAMGIAGQTAYIILNEVNIKPGDRVLVNGASGGVGSVLVQVAKAKGALVHAVCSGSNAELVNGLGADEVIDYTALDSLTAHLASTFELNTLQAVFDCVGNDMLFQSCANYLDENGVFITIVGGVGAGPIVRSKLLPVALGGVPRRYKLLALWPDGVIAKEVAKWVENGLFTNFLTDSEFSMADAIKGYERVASKRSKGKVIIKVSI
ncbi:zinc ion binding [Cytospora paraplurivora]|uniref:Zinc ion binding n=1 Tax=Cytospora paraplurivora TaxID=2898453 RepID=A0AAN9U030_9PEZI